MTQDPEELQHRQIVANILATAQQVSGALMMQMSESISSLTNYYENLRAQWKIKEQAYLETILKNQKEIEELKKPK